jgi:hypothetical protein
MSVAIAAYTVQDNPVVRVASCPTEAVIASEEGAVPVHSMALNTELFPAPLEVQVALAIKLPRPDINI